VSLRWSGHTGHAAQQLTGKTLDVVPRKGCKVVLLEKIIDTHAEELRDETYVVPMIKPREQMYAVAGNLSD